MAENSVDMQALAQAIGVSKTTVSRALNGSGRLSAATRQRVLDAAAAMGYRPNLLARSLRSQRTATLGVVVPALVSSFFAHVLAGVEDAARLAGYSILVSCSYGVPQQEREIAELLLRKSVDGLLLLPAHPTANGGFYGNLLERDTRLVFVDRGSPGADADVVATDNRRGGCLAGEHLLRLGRRQLCFLTTPSGEREATCIQERLEGFSRALRDGGGAPPEVVGPGCADTEPEERFAYEAMRHCLQTGRTFDGLFASNDSLAYGAIRALDEAGLRVPEDVSVVGYDDKDPSAYFRPALTTVRQPMRALGEEAVRALIGRIDGGGAPSPGRAILLAPQLVVRQSSAAGGGTGGEGRRASPDPSPLTHQLPRARPDSSPAPRPRAPSGEEIGSV